MLPLQLGIGSGTRTEQMCRVTKLLSFGTMNNVIRSSSDVEQDECFRQAQDLMQVQRRAFFLGWKVDLFCYIFLAYCTLIQLKNIFKRKECISYFVYLSLPINFISVSGGEKEELSLV
eukprot:TRINITY_DN7204_c0_g1_i4.p1 TRINITY_DN7204_c0_g1~~TRINITY_DN7204_c0_g1_i4.p1  ORF type:complete len:118 (-),score=4.19 TRINITY_DN7204_c0_g1_i4:105-458(-)